MKKKSKWVPEISYESDDDESQIGNLPLIHVPSNEIMPKVLFIWEARDTGTFEPGTYGEEMPVVEWELKQYAQMDTLKAGLSLQEYDKVRNVLGLEPMATAIAAGSKVTQKVKDNLAKEEFDKSGKKM